MNCSFSKANNPTNPAASLSHTHTPLWVSEFLITIFPVASYTTEMAWAIHSKPVCRWTLFILHQLHNCNASLHLVTALQPPPPHELVPGKALMKAPAWEGRACWISQHFQLRPGTCGGGRKTSVSSSRLDCNRLRDKKCFIYKDGFLWLSCPLLCFLLQVRALRRVQTAVYFPTSATDSKSKAVTLKVYSPGDILGRRYKPQKKNESNNQEQNWDCHSRDTYNKGPEAQKQPKIPGGKRNALAGLRGLTCWWSPLTGSSWVTSKG